MASATKVIHLPEDDYETWELVGEALSAARECGVTVAQSTIPEGEVEKVADEIVAVVVEGLGAEQAARFRAAIVKRLNKMLYGDPDEDGSADDEDES